MLEILKIGEIVSIDVNTIYRYLLLKDTKTGLEAVHKLKYKSGVGNLWSHIYYEIQRKDDDFKKIDGEIIKHTQLKHVPSKRTFNIVLLKEDDLGIERGERLILQWFDQYELMKYDVINRTKWIWSYGDDWTKDKLDPYVNTSNLSDEEYFDDDDYDNDGRSGSCPDMDLYNTDYES